MFSLITNEKIYVLKQLIEAAFVETETFFPSDGHDLDHLRRVCNYALIISSKIDVKIDETLLILGAYLHDLHRINLDPHWITDRSQQIIEHLELSITSNQKSALDFILFHHDDLNPNEGFAEFRIIQDADKLDRIGICGFIRAIRYGALSGEDFFSNTEKCTISHMKEILALHTKSFNYKYSKKISKKLTADMLKLIQKSEDAWT